MKQRFSSLDVKVIAHELSEALVTLRLANIYDLNSKTLLLKFAKPENRQQLLIESGFRCHLTDFARTSAAAPGAFVARLRKFLKTRRVTKVSQIGTDRIVEIEFSDGLYRLYLEFFASGNVILTDSDLKILTLLRIVPEGEGQEPQRVGSTYWLDNRQNFNGVPELTKERLRDALEKAAAKANATDASGKKSKKKSGDELRKGLSTTITEIPPILSEHAFRLTKFDVTTKLADILGNDSLLDALFRSLQIAREVVDKITSSPTCKGYIIAKPRPNATTEQNQDQDGTPEDLLYEDFHPFLPNQFENDPSLRILSFDNFNKTADEFFSSLEGQKLKSRLNEREETARRKLEAARRDQEKRVEGLQEVQSLNTRKAAAIEANVERVQEAMDAVKGLVEQGIDWVNINKLVEREKRNGNPVAQIIQLPMKLAENIITLELGEEEAEEDGDDMFDYGTDDEAENEEIDNEKSKASEKRRLQVDIKLDLTPWANAREYYDQKRVAAEKAEKTIQQSQMALKNAEEKIARDLHAGLKQEKPVLQPLRKQMWFEKFHWFISSDGYLVLGGRDAAQNEMLYKRYLRKGDVYVHADVHGAASVIIKNNPKTPDAPIPPSTLAQASGLAVCSSSAWDSKAGMSAWWVNADQVSKSAPSGEYLPQGIFMVRDKKNYMPPTQLMLGFGLLFRVSEESKAKHVKHRLYDYGEESVSKTGDAPATKGEDTEPSGAPPEQISDTHGEDVSDSESEDEGNGVENSKRANPLQTSGADDDEEEKGKELEIGVTPADLSAEMHTLAVSEQATNAAEDDSDDEMVAQPENEEEPEPEEPSPASGTPASRAGTPSLAGSHSQKKAPPKRGQRGKAKKMAKKYKDQDEEDRALLEQLIGVAAGRKKAEAEAEAKAKREAEAAAAQERRKRQQERQKREIAEHEEMRKVMLEEGVQVLNEHEAAEVTALDSLVGTPLPGDEILEAIPVCAPWTAMNKVKYKVKLQPGSLKKGKAVKDMIERWRNASSKKGVIDESAADPERMWPREIELIKALKAEDAMNCVPVSKLTVMMAGGGAGGSKGVGQAKGGGKSGGGGRGGKGSKRK